MNKRQKKKMINKYANVDAVEIGIAKHPKNKALVKHFKGDGIPSYMNGEILVTREGTIKVGSVKKILNRIDDIEMKEYFKDTINKYSKRQSKLKRPRSITVSRVLNLYKGSAISRFLDNLNIRVKDLVAEILQYGVVVDEAYILNDANWTFAQHIGTLAVPGGVISFEFDYWDGYRIVFTTLSNEEE